MNLGNGRIVSDLVHARVLHPSGFDRIDDSLPIKSEINFAKYVVAGCTSGVI